jgi:hypothetical protein
MCLAIFLSAMVIAAVLAQRKCNADTQMYALSFDCSAVEGVIRFMIFWKPASFMIFWKPASFPYHPQWT